MVGNVSSYGAGAYKISAVSGSKAQTGSGATTGTQQSAPSTTNSSSDRLSISQAGKALAANNKSTVDLTDVKAVAKEHLAQQKLAYEQKYGITTTATPSTTSSQNSAKTDTAKSSVDLTDAKAVAKEHLAQQKLAYEQKLAATTASTSKQQSGAVGSYQAIQSLFPG